MAMSYYVLKRLLAGVETTPDVLDRKMGLFTSMQRAHMGWNLNLSSIQWVKMLAKGDNLTAKLLDYSESIQAAMGNATQALVSAAEAGRSGIYLSLKWRGAGHGIAMAIDMETRTLSMFDPNLGLYERRAAEDTAELDRDFGRLYPDPGRIGSVVLTGTPRDLKSLGSD